MPGNRGLHSSALRIIHTVRLPHPFIFPIQSILRRASVPKPFSTNVHLKNDKESECKATKGWTGSSSEDHAVNRARRGDITDPEVKSTVAAQLERGENKGVADKTKSQATTERDLGRNSRRAKAEHPKAPEPIIGMNDERGEKGH